MKTKNRTHKTILSTALAAVLLFPSLAVSLDLTGANNISGAFSSANGQANYIPGRYDWATGYGHSVSGDFNSVFGFQNQTPPGNYGSILINGANNSIGGYGNTVFGVANQAGNNTQACFINGLSNIVGNATANTGVLCWVGGQGNLVTGAGALVFGSFLSDGGLRGTTLLSDNNPLSLRTTSARRTATVANSFTGVFNGGYSFRTSDGQAGISEAGLFVIPFSANTAGNSSQALVGINTATPTRGLLEVVGSVNNPQNAGRFFDNFSNALTDLAGANHSSYSIFASSRIAGFSFDAVSDARIKRIEGRSDAVRDLKTLLSIEVTDYKFKDTLANGNVPQKKVIAQQVEQYYPQAVSQHTDVVPDIYEKATAKDGWVQLTTDLKVGERVRLIGEKEEGIHEVLEVTKDGFRTSFKPAGDKVFVYGREVKDSRTVDYDAISMLNVSATQELARKVEAKDAEIAALKKQLAEQTKAIEARLARLERFAPATAVPVKLALKK